jgi:hypothetical protein
VLADDGGEEVVGRAGVGYRDLRVRLHLDARSGQRQHLHVHAVLVHVGKPVFGEVDQPALPVGDGFGPDRYEGGRSAVG